MTGTQMEAMSAEDHTAYFAVLASVATVRGGMDATGFWAYRYLLGAHEVPNVEWPVLMELLTRLHPVADHTAVFAGSPRRYSLYFDACTIVSAGGALTDDGSRILATLAEQMSIHEGQRTALEAYAAVMLRADVASVSSIEEVRLEVRSAWERLEREEIPWEAIAHRSPRSRR